MLNHLDMPKELKKEPPRDRHAMTRNFRQPGFLSFVLVMVVITVLLLFRNSTSYFPMSPAVFIGFILASGFGLFMWMNSHSELLTRFYERGVLLHGKVLAVEELSIFERFVRPGYRGRDRYVYFKFRTPQGSDCKGEVYLRRDLLSVAKAEKGQQIAVLYLATEEEKVAVYHPQFGYRIANITEEVIYEDEEKDKNTATI